MAELPEHGLLLRKEGPRSQDPKSGCGSCKSIWGGPYSKDYSRPRGYIGMMEERMETMNLLKKHVR